MDRAAIEALLAQPHTMILTVNRDGQEPLVAPVWYEYRAGRFAIWTGVTTAKAKLARRNPAVTLCIQEEHFPSKAVLVRGRAEVLPGFDRELALRIASRYLSPTFGAAYVDRYRDIPPERLCTLVVTPRAWRAWDYSEGVGANLRTAWVTDAELR